MSLLHIVNKSPGEKNSLAQCIARMLPGSTLLLIEDAVVAALADAESANLVAEMPLGCKVAVLSPDLMLRGLSEKPLLAGIQQVDYNGFVELTVAHETVSSWL